MGRKHLYNIKEKGLFLFKSLTSYLFLYPFFYSFSSRSFYFSSHLSLAVTMAAVVR
ncbi:hypothetical protein HanXRQr2_Chr13g0571471 [Helianthus annuus]|uniref:Uncharacterized protein n=1 Tax=Helianthus annuus TaxID=4232 RepID=A0A9K3HAJ5_HELAN|nr:hypothetical protein HanXRQr2_Chr13g0571471 [Helianthus annuus]KAJ0479646.1 hypothetical protein HanIR_Chr13g0622401 [Helianthus annuus]KAJ0847854.1 hypothetical protein HanPSC8_Chr13g0550171 [Helianthus annuus]